MTQSANLNQYNLQSALPFKLISANTTNFTLVSSGATQLVSIACFTNGATIGYVKIYDLARAPTTVDVPIITMGIPGVTGGAGFLLQPSIPMKLFNGLAIGITGGIADNDNTAVAANAFVVNGTYV